jgi:hypothetical protein
VRASLIVTKVSVFLLTLFVSSSMSNDGLLSMISSLKHSSSSQEIVEVDYLDQLWQLYY